MSICLILDHNDDEEGELSDEEDYVATTDPVNPTTETRPSGVWSCVR